MLWEFVLRIIKKYYVGYNNIIKDEGGKLVSFKRFWNVMFDQDQFIRNSYLLIILFNRLRISIG